MSGLIVPQFPSGLTNEELANLVAKLAKEVDWFANGNISDQNISIIAGYRASKTELKHKSGIVGMSGYDAANALAVRFWAGNADKAIAPFRVLQNGYMYSTRGFIGGWDIDSTKLSGTGTIQGGTIIGSEIMTALSDVYPRSAMSTIGNLFIAEQSADTFIKMMANYLDGVALLIENTAVNGLIGPVGDVLLINTAHTKGGIQVSSGGHLELYADILDATKLVKINSWSRFLNDASDRTLQQDIDQLQAGIDSKQPIITSGDVTVIDGVAYLDNTGISPGTWAKANYGADGRATAGFNLVEGDIPTLAQSKITNLTTDLAAKANKAQTAYQALTLVNSWVNFGGGAAPAEYYKDDFGNVKLRGIIKSGTTTPGTVILTLPVGNRPLYKIFAVVYCNTTSGQISVNPDGTVQVENIPSNGSLALDFPSFRAEQ